MTQAGVARKEQHPVLRRNGLHVGGLAFCTAALAALPAVASDWTVVELNGAEAIGGAEIRFEGGGAFSGTTGCNSFQGQARFEGGALIVDRPVATTRMACPSNALTLQDDTIVALFSGNITISFDPLEDALRLTNGDTTLGLARASASDTAFPALPQTHAGLGEPDGEPPYLNPFGLSGDMPIHSEPDAASTVVGGAFSGQVLRNDGCEGDWCRVTTLDGSIGGWAQGQTLEASDSALRAGQGVFDATGVLPCAKGIGAPMTQCAFGVARDGGGNATVAVFRRDGLTRALFFVGGELRGADTSEADGGHEVSSAREGDLLLIRVNDERYEIPDAIVRGG